MRHSVNIEAISAAVGRIQQSVPFVDKTDTADLAGHYTYKYAPHDLVWAKTKTYCATEGITVVQGGREGAGASKWLVTLLVHNPSGQWIETDVPLETAKAGMQALGAVWSYARRIGLLGALGIVPKEEDKDAQDIPLAGRGAKPPRVERDARPAGAPEDAERIAEGVLKDLPRLQTRGDIDQAAATINEVRSALSKETRERLRVAFKEARTKVDQREPGATEGRVA